MDISQPEAPPRSSSNFQAALLDIVDMAIKIAKADFGHIQIIDPVTEDLTIVASRGFSEEWLKYYSLSKGHGACGTALMAGKRVIVDDIETSPSYRGTPGEMQRKEGIRALQSTPLFIESGKVIGVFSTYYRSPGRPIKTALDTLDLLARLAANVIEQERIRNQLVESQESLAKAREDLISIIESVPRPLLVFDSDLKVLIVNKTFFEKFEVKESETIGKNIVELGNGQWNIPSLVHALKEVLSKEIFLEDYEVQHVFHDLGNRTMLLNARKVVLAGSKVPIALLKQIPLREPWAPDLNYGV